MDLCHYLLSKYNIDSTTFLTDPDLETPLRVRAARRATCSAQIGRSTATRPHPCCLPSVARSLPLTSCSGQEGAGAGLRARPAWHPVPHGGSGRALPGQRPRLRLVARHAGSAGSARGPRDCQHVRGGRAPVSCFYSQDYNKEVLQQLTMPNVAANLARLPPKRPKGGSRFFSGDWHSVGEALTSRVGVRRARARCLQQRWPAVPLQLGRVTRGPPPPLPESWAKVAGRWSNLRCPYPPPVRAQGLGGHYDLILTSESIYSVQSQRRLIECIKQVRCRASSSGSSAAGSSPRARAEL